jgi:hypothetical protein
VLQSLTKVGTRNPLFLLDEIDKLADYAAIGADHVIVMLGGPFDLKALEKAKKNLG